MQGRRTNELCVYSCKTGQKVRKAHKEYTPHYKRTLESVVHSLPTTAESLCACTGFDAQNILRASSHLEDMVGLFRDKHKFEREW